VECILNKPRTIKPCTRLDLGSALGEAEPSHEVGKDNEENENSNDNSDDQTDWGTSGFLSGSPGASGGGCAVSLDGDVSADLGGSIVSGGVSFSFVGPCAVVGGEVFASGLGGISKSFACGVVLSEHGGSVFGSGPLARVGGVVTAGWVSGEFYAFGVLGSINGGIYGSNESTFDIISAGGSSNSKVGTVGVIGGSVNGITRGSAFQ
jgi:hypothetical protein